MLLFFSKTIIASDGRSRRCWFLLLSCFASFSTWTENEISFHLEMNNARFRWCGHLLHYFSFAWFSLYVLLCFYVMIWILLRFLYISIHPSNTHSRWEIGFGYTHLSSCVGTCQFSILLYWLYRAGRSWAAITLQRAIRKGVLMINFMFEWFFIRFLFSFVLKVSFIPFIAYDKTFRFQSPVDKLKRRESDRLPREKEESNLLQFRDGNIRISYAS